MEITTQSTQHIEKLQKNKLIRKLRIGKQYQMMRLAEKYEVTRQYVNKILNDALKAGIVTRTGNRNNYFYTRIKK